MPPAIELTARPVQLQGSRFAAWLLRRLGWRLQFDGLPTRQGVMIAYPHTSNWDFVWAMMFKWATGIPFSFWAKDSLFRVPLFGRWLRHLGGLPVDRRAPTGLVGQMAERLRQAKAADEFMWLVVAVEGTRSRTEGWRSGFYQLAMQAEVPVMVGYTDYATKEVGLDSAWLLSGDPVADLKIFEARVGHRQGRHPALASPVRLR